MNEKRLVRVEEGKMLAGVCTGLARYLGVDVTVVRLLFALLTLFVGGGVLLYLILWLIMPME
ncbi:MAG TPA: PspC domain-containing protein [Promineifilum sp.]|nr:PspC domain-containing protein [Promineifilum sp.]HRO24278.1 PspC domain-containing protein [Promineifilum sp.]HRO89729.1 PspC domain-containing protein [Promineifilum sp.]HRQ12691.1 PspC domain-containing protein [Promineifilum sp.]